MAMKSALSRLSWLILKQETVGIDSIGNKYIRKLEKQIDGTLAEKRFVKIAGSFYDPKLIPPEWSQWLSRTRQEPPTDTDVQRGTQAREERRHQGEDAARAADLAWRREQGGGGASAAAFKPQLGNEPGSTTQK